MTWKQIDDLMDEATMRIYVGVRLGGDAAAPALVVVTYWRDRELLGFVPLKHHVLHSPTGFNWGYGGSGPADLALAILLDFLQEDPAPERLRRGLSPAWQVHQPFKWVFVAKFPDAGWALPEHFIAAWLAQVEQVARVAEARQTIEDFNRAMADAETASGEELEAAGEIYDRLLAPPPGEVEQ